MASEQRKVRMAETGKQFNLLLVDDNPTNLMLLAKIVEFDLPQVCVLTASNASDGLELARQHAIDGAFIDVQMPQISGLEMCRQLKADPHTAGIPLVLITAHLASPEMRAEGLEVGAYDFISQPISNVEMLARIKVMLRLADNTQLLQRGNQQLQQQVEQHSSQLRWVSGLLLSGEGELGDTDQQLLQRLAAELPEPGEISERQFIDKLISEFPLPWRRTLLKLALLDTLPLSLASKLSEIKDIEAVCDYLQRHDLSLLPAAAGEDHLCFKPQARELLREHAEQLLTPTERQQVYLLAADWYQQQGDFSTALAALVRAENYPAASQLLNQLGLVLLDDRHQPQLFQVLAEIPEEVCAACGWLALFTGVAQLQKNPQEVDAWLELARTRFVAEGDQRGELLALSQQVLQYLLADGSLNRGRQSLPRQRELCREQLERLDSGNRIRVLFSLGLAELFFVGSFAEVEGIIDRALPEALQQELVESQLYLHVLRALLAIFQGRLRVAHATLEQAEGCAADLSDRCLAVQALAVVRCELLFACGDLSGFDRHRQHAELLWGAGILQKSAFGPFLNFFEVLAQQAQGELAAASERLEAALLEGPAVFQPHLQSFLLQTRGFLSAQTGQDSAARSDCVRALELRALAAGPLAVLANLLLAGATCLLLGDEKQAGDYLEQGLAKSVELAEECYCGGYYAWLALLCQRSGRPEQAVDWFRQLLDSLRRQQRNFFFALTPGLLQELLPFYCTQVGNSEQLQQLAAEWLDSGMTDDGRLLPLLELQTLGGFRICGAGQQFDGREVGQTSRMILALLVVAPNRSLSTESLMATLWPDSSSEKARNSFDAAHSRLRKALDSSFGKRVRQDYLVLEKGMLSLHHLRIDSVEFDTAMAAARYQLQRQNFWQAELALWRADCCWRGEFMAGFVLDAELPYRREQLTQLRLEQLGALARLRQQAGDRKQAILLLQAGLRLEPTADALVQQLLVLAQQQGEIRLLHQVLASYRSALQAADYAAEEIDELIETLGPQRLNINNAI